MENINPLNPKQLGTYQKLPRPANHFTQGAEKSSPHPQTWRKIGKREKCGLGVLWEAPVLDDLRALVEFAQAGSIAGAADRLYRTPSAITRQLQRLEAALGAELLDRSVKPPRLNSLWLQGA